MNGSPANPSPLIPIFASAVWGVLLLPGLVGALLSPMMFDAPGSMDNPIAWINALIIVSFPCLCIVSIAAVWIVYARHKRKATRATTIGQLVAAGLPLLPILYVAIVLIVGWTGLILSGQSPGLHSTVIEH
jgi:hypothetical protein